MLISLKIIIIQSNNINNLFNNNVHKIDLNLLNLEKIMISKIKSDNNIN